MKALRFENGALGLAEVATPRGEGREAVVRVLLAGVCNTDLEIVRGYAGFAGTLGHEFVGVVESAPDAPQLVGRRVVGEINAGCGACGLCAGGDARHCPRRTVLGIKERDGAFAEFLRLPAGNLLLVPDEVEDERAVFAEPLAAACGISERVELRDGMRVAVVGDGKLGLLCAQAIKAQSGGASVLLIGRHENKLDIARARGIEAALVHELREDSLAQTFDVVVEASGAGGGFALATRLTRPRGTLVLKSTFHGATEIDAARIVVEEISIVGSRCGRFAPALELLRRDAVDVSSLVTEEFALADGLRAMQRAAESGVLKVLLRP